MTNGAIRCEQRGTSVLVTIDRPERHNALTHAMRQELQQVFDQLAETGDVRSVFLRGAGGKAFASGGDIEEFTETSVADFVALAREEDALHTAIERVPAPVIAVIEGYAFGGGLGIALTCDLRLCTPDSVFGITTARSVGNAMTMSGYRRLVASVGPARAKQLLMLADVMSAQDALDWGVVTEVVEREMLEERIEALAGRLAAHAPLTMWAAKESIRRLVVGEASNEDVFARVHGSADFREGVSAFLEKRRPRFINA